MFLRLCLWVAVGDVFMVFLFVISSSHPVLEKSARQPVDVQMTSIQCKIILLGQLYVQTECYLISLLVSVCVRAHTRVWVCACMHTCV